MMKIIALALCLGLTGCASTLGAIGALSSATVPKVSASAHIGDNKTKVDKAEAQVGSKTETKSTVKKVEAKKATVDQSTKKQDKKTEIGEVKGNVSVQQGPDAFTLVALASGWPLFVLFLIWVALRRVRNVRNRRRETSEDNTGVAG